MILKKSEVNRIISEFKNLTSNYIGKGKHYIQEDNPHEIGKAITKWVSTTNFNH